MEDFRNNDKKKMKRGKQKERISNYYLVRELFWLLELRIYIFRPMRMTDAILPGSPFPGNIKRLSIVPSFSFRFLLASSKDRPADTRENIPPLSLALSLYLGPIPTTDRGTFHLEGALSTFVPPLPLGDHS